MKSRVWFFLRAVLLTLGVALLAGCAPQQAEIQDVPEVTQNLQAEEETPEPQIVAPITVEF